MVEIHSVPAAGPARAPLLAALAAVGLAVTRGSFGHDDFAETPTSWAAQLAGTGYLRSHAWVALPDGLAPERCAPGDALGFAEAHLALREDPEGADLFVGVHPEARGRGVGAALYGTVDRFLAERGRLLQRTWALSPLVGLDSPHALVPASGAGVIDGAAPESRWLRARGFALEQAERHSALALPLDRATLRADLAALQHAAQRRAGERYELSHWVGPTPADLRAAVAPLHGAMSTDVPTAGLTHAAQAWDADRVRARDDRNAAKGRDWVTTIARDRATGEVAALTELYWDRDRGAGVWQEATLVLGPHRGRRLGLLVKAANLLGLCEANPVAERVYTWNADENEHMLAINAALGFEVRGFEGAWQRRRVTGAGAAPGPSGR